MADIALNGITTTPSDRISDDGDVAAMLNMVKEDGQLVGIHSPKFVTRIPEEAETYIHKTGEWTHYILSYGGKHYWADAESISTHKEIEGITGNDVTFASMGKFLIAISDKTTYHIWNNGKYNRFDSGNYSVTVDFSSYTPYNKDEEKFHVSGDNKWFEVKSTKTTDDYKGNHETYVFFDAVTRQSFYADMDALKISKLNKNEHMGYALGFAALRDYQGNYIYLSDLFAIGLPMLDSEYGLISAKRRETYAYVNMGGKYKVNIKIEAGSEGWQNIIDGVDVFLTTHTHLFDLSDNKFELLEVEKCRVNIFNNSYYRFNLLSPSDWCKEIDTMPFYKALEFSYGEIGKTKELKRVSASDNLGTDKAYVDLGRDTMGGLVTMTYNGRLHIAQARNGYSDISNIKYTGAYLFNHNPTGNNANKEYSVEAEIHSFGKNHRIEYKSSICTCKVGTEPIYYLPPILTFPEADTRKASLKINGKYLNIQLEKTSIGDLSYSCGKENYKFSFDWDYHTSQTEYDVKQHIENDDFPLAMHKFTNENDNCVGQSLPLKGIREKDDESNVLYVSESEGPLVFPAKNTLSVGTGKIIGMASATAALSTGQFGEFPLYVFTTEGIWSLAVNTTDDVGTYSRAVPVSRDVCINRYSITPIDSGVLFATDRGLMLISGSEVVCLSEVLKNGVQKIKLPKLSNAAKVCGITIDSDELSSYIYSNDLHTLLKTCRVLYDYKCQRIILYSEDDTYAFVFSLNSKTWGMMQYNFVRSLNSYPDCLAVEGDDGQWNIVDLCNNEDEPIPNQYIITRPLKLDASDVMKRISSIIARGNFRNGSITGLMLYGSRDLFNWHLVWTSKNHILRGFSGSPYKYHRVVIFSKLNPDEGITGLSIDAEGSMTNITR